MKVEQAVLRLEGFEEVSTILRSGVYALALNGVVVYVGKAKNLYSRIYAHRNHHQRALKGQKIPDWLPVRGLKFDQVFVMYVHVDQLDEVERQMIDRYKPRHNDKHNDGSVMKQPFNIEVNGKTLTLNARPAAEPMRRI